jgi:hypothetical protein
VGLECNYNVKGNEYLTEVAQELFKEAQEEVPACIEQMIERLSK